MASQTTGRADRIWRRCVMGIFDALNTAVGGLQAQSFALQNISGNIANASTTGYKGIETSFEDLIPDSTSPSRQVAGGVTAFAQATITTQGTVSVTTAENNQAATPVPITVATTLSGASPSNSLSAGFAVGDTITVDGTTLTFIAGAVSAGNNIGVGD